MDEPFMDKNNKFVRMEKDVFASDIDLSIGVYLYIRVPRVNHDNLIGLIQICDNAKEYFRSKNIEVGISSLSTMTDYATDNLDKFVSKERLIKEDFDEWYSKVSNRKEVKGKLMGRIEGEYDYFIVSMFPEQGFNEYSMYKLVKSWLEGRTVPFWELYFVPQININPSLFEIEIGEKKTIVDMEIDLIGWSIGRGLLNAVTNSDTFKMITPAILLICFVVLIVKLGSIRQSIIGLLVVSLGAFFTRGMIGLLDQIFSIVYNEEVFTVFVYIVCLIPGFSFSMRRFEEYNSTDNALGICDRWKIAGKAGFSSMNLIALIAILDFLVFMSWTNRLGSRSIFQIGVLSAAGLFFAWLLARYFLPALHKIIGGEKRTIEKGYGNNKRIIDVIVERTNSFVFKLSKSILSFSTNRKVPFYGLSFLVVIVIATVVLISKGFMSVESDPGEFLKNTILEEIRQEMKKDGRPGFNVHEIYIAPTKGRDLNDPEFIEQLWKYTDTIAMNSRRLFSYFDSFLTILEHDYPRIYHFGASPKDAIIVISKENLGEDFTHKSLYSEKENKAIVDEARELISGIWNDIRDNSGSELIKHFLAKNDILLLATDEDTSSNGMAEFRDMILSEGYSYDLLNIKTPGKLAIYPEVDNSITRGSMLNSTLSQIMIAVICGIWITIVNRKKYNKLRLCPYMTGTFMAIPFVFSTCSLFLIMMLLGIPLDIASSTIGSISVSVAIDLPIFFIGSFQPLILSGLLFEETLLSKRMTDEGGRILADFAINTPAFIPLMFSAYPANFRTGFMMVLVMVACTIGTLVIMAPMMRWAVRKVR